MLNCSLAALRKRVICVQDNIECKEGSRQQLFAGGENCSTAELITTIIQFIRRRSNHSLGGRPSINAIMLAANWSTYKPPVRVVCQVRVPLRPTRCHQYVIRLRTVTGRLSPGMQTTRVADRPGRNTLGRSLAAGIRLCRPPSGDH